MRPVDISGCMSRVDIADCTCSSCKYYEANKNSVSIGRQCGKCRDNRGIQIGCAHMPYDRVTVGDCDIRQMKQEITELKMQMESMEALIVQLMNTINNKQ